MSLPALVFASFECRVLYKKEFLFQLADRKESQRSLWPANSLTKVYCHQPIVDISEIKDLYNSKIAMGEYFGVLPLISALFARYGVPFCSKCSKEMKVSTLELTIEKFVRRLESLADSPKVGVATLYQLPKTSSPKKIIKKLLPFITYWRDSGVSRFIVNRRILKISSETEIESVLEESLSRVVSNVGEIAEVYAICETFASKKLTTQKLDEACRRIYDQGAKSLAVCQIDGQKLAEVNQVVDGYICEECGREGELYNHSDYLGLLRADGRESREEEKRVREVDFKLGGILFNSVWDLSFSDLLEGVKSWCKHSKETEVEDLSDELVRRLECTLPSGAGRVQNWR